MRKARGLAIVAAVALAALSCADASSEEAFRLAKSPGGVAFWHLKTPEAPTSVLVGGFADAFALAHPNKTATSLVGAALTRYGPKGMSSGDFNEELKDVQAHCGTSASPMTATFSVEAKPAELGEALDLCFRIVTEPALRDGDIEKIRKAAIAGRQRMMENRDAIAGIVMRRVTQASGPFALWSEPEAIGAVTPADVDLWRREVFARDNLTIVAAGPLDASEFGPMIDRTFGRLPEHAATPATDPPKPAFPGKTIVLEREGPQTSVALEGSYDFALGEGPVALIGVNVLGGGLDRRLSRAVRGELGATYGISAGMGQIAPKQRTIGIRSALDNQLAVAGLKRIREVYETWWRDGVTDDEATSARNQLANGFDKGAETPAGRALALLSLLRGGASAEDEARYTERLRAIDTGKVNALMRDKAPRSLTTVIVATKADGFGADCVIHAVEEVDGCR